MVIQRAQVEKNHVYPPLRLVYGDRMRQTMVPFSAGTNGE